MRVWIGIVMIGVALLSVTSCTGSDSPGSSGKDTSPATSASPVTSPSPAASRRQSVASNVARSSNAPTEASSTVSSAPSPAIGGCRTSALQLSQGRADGTAGSDYVTYYLQNRGSVPCTLTGFPGFSLLDANGAIIQRPAVRTDAHYSTVTLRLDGRVQFVVRTIDPSIPGTACSAKWRTTQVQVYPPNQTTPLRQRSTVQACDLTVGPVRAAL